MTTIRQTSSNRRLSLLKAALTLFSTQGYAGTTTRAIAEHSGVTEAILFRHFHSKEELLCAVVEQFSPRPLFSPPLPTNHTLPVRHAVEMLLRRYLDAVWANRVFLLMVFTTPKREQAVFAEIWTEFHAQGVYLYTLLQERSDRNELRPDIALVAADVIAAATSGYLQRALYEPPAAWEVTRDTYVSNLLAILFDGITRK